MKDNMTVIPSATSEEGQTTEEKALTQTLQRIADHLDENALAALVSASSPTQWMDTDDVADYLQVSPKAVRQAANRGDLPGHKFPPNRKQGRWRFRKEEVDKAMCRRRPKPKRKGLTAW